MRIVLGPNEILDLLRRAGFAIPGDAKVFVDFEVIYFSGVSLETATEVSEETPVVVFDEAESEEEEEESEESEVSEEQAKPIEFDEYVARRRQLLAQLAIGNTEALEEARKLFRLYHTIKSPDMRTKFARDISNFAIEGKYPAIYENPEGWTPRKGIEITIEIILEGYQQHMDYIVSVLGIPTSKPVTPEEFKAKILAYYDSMTAPAAPSVPSPEK